MIQEQTSALQSLFDPEGNAAQKFMDAVENSSDHPFPLIRNDLEIQRKLDCFDELLEALEIALDRLVENNCDTDDEYEWTSKIRAAIRKARGQS